MKIFKTTLLLLSVIATAFSSSCATTRGFGQDLQKVGNRLENEANATGGAAPASSAAAPAATSDVPSAY